MADWGNIYRFDTSDDLTGRVRRLERGKQYLRAGNLVVPSGDFSGLPQDILDANNKIAIVTAINPKGSVPPAGVVGTFGFSATTTSITIYWDGTNGSVKLKIIRADETVVNIPSNNMTISGLIANTSYGFLPFWSAFNNCGVGFIKGDAGTPQFAFTTAARNVQASMQQSLLGREPLSGGFTTFSTPAAGTSGGTGGTGGYGGGPGTCVMLNTDIKPFGEGQEYSTFHHRQTDWINLAVEDYPRTLNCTPNHPLFHDDKGKIRADELKAGDWIMMERGVGKIAEVRQFYKDCTKVEVKMPRGHLFYANGFLSHNNKLNLI
jgi:hypothetical protein